jgi:hypothetical protein
VSVPAPLKSQWVHSGMKTRNNRTIIINHSTPCVPFRHYRHHHHHHLLLLRLFALLFLLSLFLFCLYELGPLSCSNKNLRWLCSGLLRRIAGTSETSDNFYETTRYKNPEDSHLRTRRRENLKFHNRD